MTPPIPQAILVLLFLCSALSQGAVDDASRYTPGTEGVTRWMSNGHRGDLGFGVWNFEAVPHAGSAGRFLGDSTAGVADINTGGRSFGLFAHPAGSPTPYAAAIRRFDKPALTTGDSITFQVAVNFRNGNKGLIWRDINGTEQWNFDVRAGGYSVRNGPSGTTRDDGQQFGGYHANTVFTFTFTQRERQMDWTIQRSGGITQAVSGSFPATSGTLADIRFYVSGTDNAATNPQNNLYFNSFNFTPAARGDAPLTAGERRMPGWVPSHTLRYQDPAATTVTVRHSGDGFVTSFPMTKTGDVWELDVRTLGLSPGWHTFKFRPNSQWEDGCDRRLYLDADGRVAQPPVVYLTWQRDPTTTMTVNWFNTSPAQNTLRYRVPGEPQWTILASSNQAFPHAERTIHTAEITGLAADAAYEFQVDGYEDTFTFRTMPAMLSRPVKFGVGGDVDVGATADAMTAAIAGHDPDFLVIGGDHAYEDARAENFWKWYRYMESWFRNARSPDGRMIPLVVGIGNHEVRNGYGSSHPDFDNSAAWRDRYAAYYYRTFAWPGPAVPYGAMDFGGYLSIIVTDTEHSSPQITGTDPQSQWLATALDARRNVPHLLPVHHVPAYTSYRSFNEPISQRLRQHWVPLYEQAGVKLVFEHHDHTYKVTKPLLNGAENTNGIVFLGDGLWGVSSRPPDTSRWYLQAASEQHHAHLVTITSSNRIIQTVGTNGQFFGGTGPANILLQQPIDGIPRAPVASLTDLATNSLSLSWDSVGNATGYRVLRDGQLLATVSGTSFTDAGWTPAANHTYRIEPLNRSGTNSAGAPVAPAPKQVWSVTRGLPWNGTGLGAPGADPDGDGRRNLLEYFHDLNPLAAEGTPAALGMERTPDTLALLYRRNPAATDLTHGVTWRARLDDTAGWSGEGVIDAAAPDLGSDWRRASLALPEDSPTMLMRLEVRELAP